LSDGGTGFRFQLKVQDQVLPAFAIRYRGKVYAYLNRCAHKLVELDWLEGQFFDDPRQHLICATHGALYNPANGQCVQGPCRGGALVPVAVHEHEDGIWLTEQSGVMLS